MSNVKKQVKREMLDVLDYTEPVTKIYFVRHGQTRANKERLIIGQWDLPLNDLGKRQAKSAGKKLKKLIKKENIDTIISSPLKRTRQTANIISKEIGINNVVLNKDVIEKSEGNWEGYSYWNIRDIDSNNYYRWLEDPFRRKPPKGETVIDLSRRLKKFQSYVMKRYKGKNIIVASHSGPIRMFLLNMLGCDVSKFWHMKVENGSITEVRLSKKHQMIWNMNRI